MVFNKVISKPRLKSALRPPPIRTKTRPLTNQEHLDVQKWERVMWMYQLGAVNNPSMALELELIQDDLEVLSFMQTPGFRRDI